MEPGDEELSDSAWIEVDDREWTDEQLMDDARPGRRKGNSDKDVKLRIIVKEVERLSREGVEGGIKFDGRA